MTVLLMSASEACPDVVRTLVVTSAMLRHFINSCVIIIIIMTGRQTNSLINLMELCVCIAILAVPGNACARWCRRSKLLDDCADNHCRHVQQNDENESVVGVLLCNSCRQVSC